MLNNGKELPGEHVGHGLHNTRRPLDAQSVNARGVAEAEMRFERVRVDATAGADLPQLPKRLSGNGGLRPHLRADGRPIRYCADAFDLEPIVLVAVVAIEAIVLRAADGHALAYEHVQETIVVVFAPGATRGIANVIHTPHRK